MPKGAASSSFRDMVQFKTQKENGDYNSETPRPEETCHGAAWQRCDSVSEFFVDLPQEEQVSRGQELLQLLKRKKRTAAPAGAVRATTSSEGARVEKSAAVTACRNLGNDKEERPEVIVTVKHTFIELVESPGERRRGLRDRALSDSALSDERFQSSICSDDEEYRRQGFFRGKTVHGDFCSDISTDDPSSEDDTGLETSVVALGGWRPPLGPAEFVATDSLQVAAQDDRFEEWQQHYQAQQCIYVMPSSGFWVPEVAGSLQPPNPSIEATAMQTAWCMPNCNKLKAAHIQAIYAALTQEDQLNSQISCSTPIAFDSNTAYGSSVIHDGHRGGSGELPEFGASSGIDGSEETDDTETPWTTVMLRNLPNCYSRCMLLQLLYEEGFSGRFDFVYLPMDFKSQAGLGYAFVNFVSPEDADRCMQHFEGFTNWQVPSGKACSVLWGSPHQGFAAHVERYRNSPVMHDSVPDEWKPAIFGPDGDRMAFPEPTLPIRKPKIRS